MLTGVKLPWSVQRSRVFILMNPLKSRLWNMSLFPLALSGDNSRYCSIQDGGAILFSIWMATLGHCPYLRQARLSHCWLYPDKTSQYISMMVDRVYNPPPRLSGWWCRIMVSPYQEEPRVSLNPSILGDESRCSLDSKCQPVSKITNVFVSPFGEHLCWGCPISRVRFVLTLESWKLFLRAFHGAEKTRW